MQKWAQQEDPEQGQHLGTKQKLSRNEAANDRWRKGNQSGGRWGCHGRGETREMGCVGQKKEGEKEKTIKKWRSNGEVGGRRGGGGEGEERD